MVKVSGGGRSFGAVAAHLRYIGRHGKIDIETDEGERLAGSGADKSITDDWMLGDDYSGHGAGGEDARASDPSKLVHNIVLSMPANTAPEKLLAAAKAFAREEFALKNPYAMVLHTDQDHPHVHLVVKAVGLEALGPHAVARNPCHELKRLSEPVRTRCVWDREFTGVYGIASPIIQVTMDLATITGQREDDLLTLPNRDPDVYTEEGVVFRPAKTKRRNPRHGKIVETSKIVIVEWSPELREVIERARKLGPDIRRTLLCNLQGEPYSGSGFRSNWHRLIQTALTGRKRKNGVVTLAPVLKESFTFNDLRAKNATDEEDFEQAHNRLAHSDRKTTQMVYIRRPRRARAGRKVGT
jgi:integrase